LFVFKSDTNIQLLFEFANYFKDIFNLFLKSADNQRKKTAANTQLAK